MNAFEITPDSQFHENSGLVSGLILFLFPTLSDNCGRLANPWISIYAVSERTPRPRTPPGDMGRIRRMTQKTFCLRQKKRQYQHFAYSCLF